MSRITLGNVTIDRDRFEVWVDLRRINLTFVEFELLYNLARNAGKVLARPRLMHAVWNEPSRGHDRKLTVHMSRLRTKMRGSEPWRIETVTKRGYAFVAEPAVLEATNGSHPQGMVVGASLAAKGASG
jgi:DNA-binding response OmpR family regulator